MTSQVSNSKVNTKKVSKKIKVGTKVKIIAGKQKGESGEVLKVFRDQGMLIVQNINCKKKHKKPTQEGQAGEIVEFEKPIQVSNVAISESN
nr:ribosomal protein L24 [Erythrotrichia welwitschii]